MKTIRLLVISICLIILSGCVSTDTGQTKSKKQRIVDAMKSAMPIKVDDFTTIKKVRWLKDSDTLVFSIYWRETEEELMKILDLETLQLLEAKKHRKKTCSDDVVLLHNFEVLRYDYFDKHIDFLFNVFLSKSDCSSS